MAALSRSFASVRASVGLITWAPLVRFSRSAVLSILGRIEVGRLVIIDNDGTVTHCGEPHGICKGPEAELRVVKDSFWVRTLLCADMGFAESFMLGEVVCSNLVAFFRIFILNRARLSNATTLTSSFVTAITNFARSTNTLANSQLNVAAHYDISNTMFAAFLSEDMTYSCPIWRSINDPKSASESLEEAQQRKLQYYICQAKIKASDHVLEIGTGWGSFAIAAVRTTGCKVTTITLSKEQKVLAEERIAAAGYADHIKVLLCDYRALPTPTGALYDKVVSIEMLEAVGREYLDVYFQCVHRLLKPHGGIAIFQSTTMHEARYEAYSKGEDFIRKYIFPGGHLPTVTQLVGSIERGSKGSLIVDGILNIGGHYPKALRAWRQNFEVNFYDQIRPALLDKHPDMSEKDIDLFRRKWEYYFAYSEAGFNTGTLGVVIITVGREGAMELLEGIPL